MLRLIERVEARNELGERERLGQIVVTAGRKPRETVGQRVTCGEEDDRCRDSLDAERLDDVTTVGVGKPDVDYERVRVTAVDDLEQFARCSGCRHFEALLDEPAGDERPQLEIVL